MQEHYASTKDLTVQDGANHHTDQVKIADSITAKDSVKRLLSDLHTPVTIAHKI